MERGVQCVQQKVASIIGNFISTIRKTCVNGKICLLSQFTILLAATREQQRDVRIEFLLFLISNLIVSRFI